MIEKKLTVKGIVQGVGFRPFVYKLAIEKNLRGYVNNSSKGVYIVIQGEERDVKGFIKDLKEKAPTLSHIDNIFIEERKLSDFNDFEIIASKREDGGITLISPDIGTCEKCMEEVVRGYETKRFLYPFTNCTNCGPRFTIIKSLPYDRKNTTMRKFKMCSSCEEEYENPLDRRFHAEPTCCKECGPQVKLIDTYGTPVEGDPIEVTRKLLREGYIVAVKGIGGFNLVCNGKDEKAIENLRKRKHRPRKPLALMMKDMKVVKEFCLVNEKEEELLLGNKKPIVLLHKKNHRLPVNISFDNTNLGVLLPYSPLHQLLFHEDLSTLVFTSGNYSGSNIIYKNDEAIENLNKVADYFLIHDREIYKSIDDSVVREYLNDVYIIRGGRGYFPRYIKYENSKVILACGGQLKNSFALSIGDYIYLSPYIGDLDYVENQENFISNIDHIKTIYNATVSIMAYDNHPNYWTSEYVKNESVMKVGIYHHHAHVVSCMAENHVKEEVIGLAFDGIGYGEDGHLWGGEFLICNYKEFTRVGQLSYMQMPGGDGATRNPWVMGVSLAYKAYGGNMKEIKKALPKGFDSKNVDFIFSLLNRNGNQPLCSSMGRLFDGVGSLLGFTEEITYEGEGAVYLENLAAKCVEKINVEKYKYSINYFEDRYILNTDNVVKAIMQDLKENGNIEGIALKFHNTIISATCEICSLIRDKYKINRVTLSGGVFQNKILLIGIYEKLKNSGFEVFYHKLVPCNDSGIALGQLIIAEELSKG